MSAHAFIFIHLSYMCFVKMFKQVCLAEDGQNCITRFELDNQNVNQKIQSVSLVDIYSKYKSILLLNLNFLYNHNLCQFVGTIQYITYFFSPNFLPSNLIILYVCCSFSSTKRVTSLLSSMS